ncbi:MAG: hypothetical protein RI897_790 [Verrucomicrobiota bacterium]
MWRVGLGWLGLAGIDAKEAAEFVFRDEFEVGVFELAGGGIDGEDGGLGLAGGLEDLLDDGAGDFVGLEFEADTAGVGLDGFAAEGLADGVGEGVDIAAHFDFEDIFGEEIFEVVAGSVEEELALVEDEEPVADAVDIAEDMGAEDDGFTLAELFEQAEGLAAADGVESGGGFIPDEEVGIIHEGGGDPEAGAHAGGVGLDFAACVIGESDGAEESSDAGLVVAFGEAEALADEVEVTDGGEVAGEGWGVGEEADTLAQVFGAGVHGLLEDCDLAGGGGDEAEGDTEEGGFA